MGRHDRIAELAELNVSPPDGATGGRLEVVDLATGYGRTIRAVLRAATGPLRVHAVDVGADLDEDLLRDERVRAVLADLDASLPFASASVDRVFSVNVAEHLQDAAAHLVDCHRILRPGGLLVLAHSDWDTAMFASRDDQLTRDLVDNFVGSFPSWAQRADGFMGRKLLGLAADSPFELVSVQTWADCHLRFDAESVARKVARGIVAAAATDTRLAARTADWFADLERDALTGRFLFTVTDVALALRRAAD
jgi:SAM-dependent methyltransferase